METNDLFSDAQHGFRRGRSTSRALLSLVNRITDAFEANEVVALSLCHLSKVFDIVPHDILFQKLSTLGLQGTALDTIISYLTNRSQVISIGDAYSAARGFKHGVPQRSVLGSLLFVVLVNNLSLGGMTPL